MLQTKSVDLPKFSCLSGGTAQKKADMTTTNYLYEGKNGYLLLNTVVALETAIRESVTAGHTVVPMDVDDFRRIMHDADSEDSRALQEQLETFARETGLGHIIDNRGQVIRFRG